MAGGPKHAATPTTAAPHWTLHVVGTEAMNLMLGALDGRLAESRDELGSKVEGLARAGRLFRAIGPIGAATVEGPTLTTGSTATSTAVASEAVVKALRLLVKALGLSADVESRAEEAVALRKVAAVVAALAECLGESERGDDERKRGGEALDLAMAVKVLSALQKTLPDLPGAAAAEAEGPDAGPFGPSPKWRVYVDNVLFALQTGLDLVAELMDRFGWIQSGKWLRVVVKAIYFTRAVIKLTERPGGPGMMAGAAFGSQVGLG
ncbi:uncharacterized protein LOC116957899 [Petromyzon marinus]|uniref:Uncharacterized protein LOC116957899 n=1 Tax=Petromyzon marinus TaxID=7757 RepID=A0AAJ7XK46_PETMA|nr:uncharacterized protein LOC116957899 [Petromyzon marinus]